MGRGEEGGGEGVRTSGRVMERTGEEERRVGKGGGGGREEEDEERTGLETR